jgi:hypothetical protein
MRFRGGTGIVKGVAKVQAVSGLVRELAAARSRPPHRPTAGRQEVEGGLPRDGAPGAADEQVGQLQEDEHGDGQRGGADQRGQVFGGEFVEEVHRALPITGYRIISGTRAAPGRRPSSRPPCARTRRGQAGGGQLPDDRAVGRLVPPDDGGPRLADRRVAVAEDELQLLAALQRPQGRLVPAAADAAVQDGPAEQDVNLAAVLDPDAVGVVPNISSGCLRLWTSWPA